MKSFQYYKIALLVCVNAISFVAIICVCVCVYVLGLALNFQVLILSVSR